MALTFICSERAEIKQKKCEVKIIEAPHLKQEKRYSTLTPNRHISVRYRSLIRTYGKYFIFKRSLRAYFNIRYFGVRFIRETYAVIFRSHFIVIALYHHCFVRL